MANYPECLVCLMSPGQPNEYRWHTADGRVYTFKHGDYMYNAVELEWVTLRLNRIEPTVITITGAGGVGIPFFKLRPADSYLHMGATE